MLRRQILFSLTFDNTEFFSLFVRVNLGFLLIHCSIISSVSQFSIGMQHISIQPFRPVFLSDPGTPPVPWRRWRDMFDDYLLVVGLPTPSADAAAAVVTAAVQRKAAILRSSLGAEGYRVYCTLTDNNHEAYDASGHAVGACLSQKLRDGKERPVAFASRTLSGAERKYSASEREALAALWACEKWHYYLYGRQFTLVTDHQALTSLLSSGGTGHRPLRLHRWASRLYR